MDDQTLKSIWASQNEKLEETLLLNKMIVQDITKRKLNSTIGSLRMPKITALLIGIPYTLILFLITFIGFKANAVFVTIGFGSIALLMTILIIGYLYHMYLIQKIIGSDEIIDVQNKIANLTLSSFKLTRLAILQIPLWSLCWVSLDIVKASPFIYGGINLMIFVTLTCFTFWLYQNLNTDSEDSFIHKLFFSGNEWEPIKKSKLILDQLKEYE